MKKTPESKLIGDFTKKARQIVDRIAKNRDELRDLLAEYEDVLDSTTEAHAELERALDTLSQYV